MTSPPPLHHGNEGQNDGGETASAIIVDKVGAIAGDQATSENNAPPAKENVSVLKTSPQTKSDIQVQNAPLTYHQQGDILGQDIS